jgi:hypothetical protein
LASDGENEKSLFKKIKGTRDIEEKCISNIEEEMLINSAKSCFSSDNILDQEKIHFQSILNNLVKAGDCKSIQAFFMHPCASFVDSGILEGLKKTAAEFSNLTLIEYIQFRIDRLTVRSF